MTTHFGVDESGLPGYATRWKGLIFIGISLLVISLFGATEPMVARFAWILAISFVATGSMLLEVARCARREDA